MTSIDNMTADLESHRITGYIPGVTTNLDVELITEIDENLWMGGCQEGVSLSPDFDFVMSLYVGERYAIAARTLRFEHKLYDSAEIPEQKRLVALARDVNDLRAGGKTLVHCQAGLNRSGLITALALILEGMEPAEAIALLRQKRSPHVLCNPAFEAWLMEWTDEPLTDEERAKAQGRHPLSVGNGGTDDPREAKIARMESAGMIDPNCDQCKEQYESIRATGHAVVGPSHKAKSGCKSGGRPHCTCDGCF